MYLVIQHWTELGVSLAVCAVTSAILKFTWYDHLGPGQMYLTGPQAEPVAVAVEDGEPVPVQIATE